jgi:cell wall-associated NlpC family hydrolase
VTAPVTSAIGEITAAISSIQARIASVSPSPAAPAATTPATGSPTSAQAFAAQYATASAATGTTPTPASTGSATGGDAVVADAKKYLGIPYVWGGESTSGMDCSGLVQKTFADLGVQLPRVAADQAQEGTPVASLQDAQPGDLLFFGNPAYHVAIYAGDGKLIESPEPGKTVHITDVYQTPTSIRHIDLPGTAGATTAGGLSASQLTAAGISPNVARFADQFAAAEAAHHLPAGMLAAVAQQESGGNPSAVSPAGAEGLMQLMPSTAAGEGVNPFDPSQAIQAAARILSRNLSHFSGSVPLALAGYNAGVGAVDQYGGIPPYAETQNYVRRITAMMAAGG